MSLPPDDPEADYLSDSECDDIRWICRRLEERAPSLSDAQRIDRVRAAMDRIQGDRYISEPVPEEKAAQLRERNARIVEENDKATTCPESRPGQRLHLFVAGQRRCLCGEEQAPEWPVHERLP